MNPGNDLQPTVSVGAGLGESLGGFLAGDGRAVGAGVLADPDQVLGGLPVADESDGTGTSDRE